MSRTREEIKNYFNERPELKTMIEVAKLKELLEKNRKSPPYWRGGFFIDFLINNYNYLVGLSFAEEQGEDYIANAMAKSIRNELTCFGSDKLKEEGEKFWTWASGK